MGFLPGTIYGYNVLKYNHIVHVNGYFFNNTVNNRSSEVDEIIEILKRLCTKGIDQLLCGQATDNKHHIENRVNLTQIKKVGLLWGKILPTKKRLPKIWISA